MATNATRIMVRAGNSDWTSQKTKSGLHNQPQSTARVAAVKPVSKTMLSPNVKDVNGLSSDNEEEKHSPVTLPSGIKDSVNEKDALVVELEKCLTELENDSGSHSSLADDYSKIEKEKDDLLSELEITFQELEEYMAHVQELEAEKKEIMEERDELTAQVENLKYCLSGRQEIQDQQSGWKDKKAKLEEEIKELQERNDTLQEEVEALYEERQSLISSLLNLNSEQVNEVIKTRSRSSSTVSTDSSASIFLRGENEELSRFLKEAEDAEEKALSELEESKVHIMALKQTIVEQEHEIRELTETIENLDQDSANRQTHSTVNHATMTEATAKEIEDLKSELETLQKDLASKRALLHSQSLDGEKTKENINKLEALIHNQTDEISRLHQEANKKDEEIDEFRKKHDAIKTEFTIKVRKLNEEKMALDTKLKETNSAAGQLRKALDDVELLNQEISKLKGLIVAAEDKVKRLTDDNESAKGKLKELDAEKQKLQRDFDKLKADHEKTCKDLSRKTGEYEKVVYTTKNLQTEIDGMTIKLQEALKERDNLSLSLRNANTQKEKLSGDNNQLNKRILENHKQKIESLEDLLESEQQKVKGFDKSVEALRLQIDGDKKQMADLKEENERLLASVNTMRLDNTKLREQSKRQRMTSNSVQELVQHKLREEKQSLEKRCETLQSALDKANTENKCILQQLDDVNESSASTIKSLKTKKNELQFEYDSLKQKYNKSQEEVVSMKKEIDSYESFNQIHVDRKLEAAAPGNSLLERLEDNEQDLKTAKERISQLEADNMEYPKKLEESETLINDLQRALSHANDLAMEKSLEVSRSKRNLEKKMEKILKENIELKRKLFVEGSSNTGSTLSTTPFHAHSQVEATQNTMYEPKNDQRMRLPSSGDIRHIDAPAVIKKTELLTVAQLASPPLQHRDPENDRRPFFTQGSLSSDGSPRSRRSSAGLVQDRSDSGKTTAKMSLDSPPVKPPPPAFYEARLKKTSSKRDTPHPERMYQHRSQLSLDGSMDEIAAKRLLDTSTKPLQGGRLEHWV